MLIKLAEKAISRKFIAWAVATVALFTNYIDGSDWEMITMLYVGAQSVLDWKLGKTNEDNRDTRGT